MSGCPYIETNVGNAVRSLVFFCLWCFVFMGFFSVVLSELDFIVLVCILV